MYTVYMYIYILFHIIIHFVSQSPLPKDESQTASGIEPTCPPFACHCLNPSQPSCKATYIS